MQRNYHIKLGQSNYFTRVMEYYEFIAYEKRMNQIYKNNWHYWHS